MLLREKEQSVLLFLCGFTERGIWYNTSMSNGSRITIGILAHVDAGKTTLSEALLYKAGVIRKFGRVDHGDAMLDSDAQEKERGITIFAGQAVFALSAGGESDAAKEVTLIDTPGHVDFSAEMERTLKVLDYAILVISGKEVVQSHTLTLWKLLRHYEIPTFIFVNKMDLETAGEEEILRQLREQLDSSICRVNGSLEEIAMCSKEMLEEYLTDGTVSDESLAKSIRSRSFSPCCFGAALKLEGIDELMEEMARLTIGYEGDSAAEPAYRVFRVTRDRQGERLTHLKVLSGTLHVRGEICGEKVNQIRI